MTISAGSSLQNRSSRPTRLSPASLQSGLGVCVLAGIADALVDLYIHIPMHMPGWRGLLIMGILVTARQVSGRNWAASAAAFTAALTSLALAGPPRFSTLVFLGPGLMIDLVYLAAPRLQARVFIAALAAALGNVTKFAVSFSGYSVFTRNLTANELLPWLSHFAFGCLGGILAFMLAMPIIDRRKRR